MRASPAAAPSPPALSFLRRASRSSHVSGPAPRSQALLETEGYSEHESNVLKMLGYYSMIGQLRCLTIIGEYEAALRALEPINIFDRKTLLAAKLTTCHITLFYYAGFCYLMLGRHVDAARCFNTIIGFISRVTSAGTQMRPVMYEEVLKKNEQLFSLLAVTVALCPRAIRFLDDPVANQLMAKHRETLSALTTAEGPDAVKDRFQEACPRFINPDMPNYTSQTELGRHNAAVASRQVAAFMEEVNRRKKVPAMRQCLSLYAVSPPPPRAPQDPELIPLQCSGSAWRVSCGVESNGEIR